MTVKKIVKARYVTQEEFDELQAAHFELNAQFLELTRRTHTVREIASKLISDAVIRRQNPEDALEHLSQIYAAVR